MDSDLAAAALRRETRSTDLVTRGVCLVSGHFSAARAAAEGLALYARLVPALRRLPPGAAADALRAAAGDCENDRRSDSLFDALPRLDALALESDAATRELYAAAVCEAVRFAADYTAAAVAASLDAMFCPRRQKSEYRAAQAIKDTFLKTIAADADRSCRDRG